MGLAHRTFKAAFWIYALNMTTRLLGLVRTVILARLLTPNDFGVVAIAMLVIAGLEVFTRSGLEHSIVREIEVSRHELHALWMFDVLRGVVLGVVIFLTAPYVGAFMNSPGSIAVIQVFSVVPVLMFLRNVDMIIIWKELDVKKMVAVEAVGQTVSVIVGISMALLSPNIWALVVSVIADRLAQLIMSYIVSRSWPRLVWDWPVVKYHFRYGRKILAESIGSFFYNTIDNSFVGKFMGGSALGLYDKAYQFGNLPTTELTRVLSRVLFPSFSKLQHDIVRLKAAFLSVQNVISLIVAPISVFLFLFAYPLVHVLLGNQWLPMVPAFKVLVLSGGIRALRDTIGDVFRAMGVPGIDACATFAKLALILALLWPCRSYGITGVAFLVLSISLLEFPILMWFGARKLDMSYLSIYRPIILPFIIALVAGLAIFLVNAGTTGTTSLLWGFLGLFGVYLAIGAILEYFFHLNQFSEIWRVFSLARLKVG